MSTENQVASLLARLDQSLNKKKGGKQDWAKLSEERKRAFWKPAQGKNQIIIFTPAFSADPFIQWGFHKGLQEVEYYSVPCDAYNKNESCVICDVVEELKKADWAGNKHLWMPIEQKVEHYAPIIDMTSAATMAQGPRWYRISKTVLNQLIESMKNLEGDERPFYDMEQPSRINITYDKNQAPALQYNVSFKELKEVPSADQYAEWSGSIRPVGDFIFSKTQEDNKRLVDEYFARIAETLDAAAQSDGMPQDAPFEAPTSAAESKLSRLKK